MAEFAGDLQSFKNSFNFLEMDSSIEMMNQFPELNPSFLENPCLNIQSSVGFCNDHSFILSQTQQQQQQQLQQQQQQQQQPQFPINFAGNSLQGIFHLESSNSVATDHSLASTQDAQHEMKKRKMVSVSDSSSGNSSTPVSETGFRGNDTIKRKNSSGRGKKGRSNSKEVVDKPKEVVHVRARRGQATDSHSLAERVRREKINERLRCLQDLVPGCYKTMGMAVMLDEIISYVQSLQNQVEFLSMKLTAASSFYDFNSDAVDATQIVQGTNAYEAQEMERLVRGDGYGGFSCFHSTLPL